jgi:threonine dehydrogenase-like Zn-dependent dehydrogenase
VRALAALFESREVKVIEKEPDAPTLPDQVTLRMLEVGICGTDREIGAFEYGTPPAGEDHLVIGHEALAEVVEVGGAVGRLRPGDLVVPTVRRPCSDPRCRACRVGHQDFCYTGKFSERGIKEAHGYLSETVVEREEFLVQVPDALREVAIVTEPLTIAEKALAQVFWMMQRRPPWLAADTSTREWGQGLTALVLGVGPVGLLGAMVLATAGFTTYVYSREAAPSPRTDLATAIGATYVSSKETTIDELAEMTGNVDLVYEAVGQSRFALDALRVLGQNGIFILTGVPGLEALTQSDPAKLMRTMVLKNQVLLGTVNAGRADFASAIDHLGQFVERWPEATRTLIAARYPLEESGELLFGRPVGVKSVVALA